MAKNKDDTYTGYIYKIDNLVNGKCYIGQTTTTIEHRWGQHKTDYTNTNPMYKSFRKYGIENFKISEIANYTRDTKDKLLSILNKKEIYYIKKFNSLVTENGYNLSIGGNNSGVYKSNPVDVYDREGNLLCQYSSATSVSVMLKYDTSSIIDCCNGLSVPLINYIFRFRGDPFNKYSIDRSYYTEIYQFTLNGILVKRHESVKDAFLSVGGTRSGMQNMLRGKNKTCKGYYWSYTNEFRYIPIKDVRIKVDKYSLCGDLVETYDSAKEAQLSVGATNSHSIIKVCKGECMQAFGFVWRYGGEPFDKYENFLKLKENNFSYGKPVDMYSINKEYIRSFNSMKEAADYINGDKTNISACCLGKAKTVLGYIFRFHNDPIDKYSCNYKTQKQPIYIYDLNGNLLNIFPSKNKAFKETGIGYHMIEEICDGRNNHIYQDKILLYESDAENIQSIVSSIAA